MSVNSPSPQQRPGDPIPKPLPEDEAAAEDVASLFDVRPADAHEKSSWLKAALEGLSKAFRDAAAWVVHQINRISTQDDPVFDVSRPFNVKKETLPEDFARKIADTEGELRAAEEKKAFVASDNLPVQAKATVPDPGQEAFDAYMRLYKRDKGQSGSVDCPQNFREGAERYALEFLKQVSERKKNAEDSGEDFWLKTEDHEKFKIAVQLLKQERSKELKELSGDDLLKVPIQTNSNQQLQSFIAWMEWSQNAGSLPQDTDFSLDAAVAYAWELSAKHAGKAEATDPAMKKQLSAAAELISREANYRHEYSAALNLAKMLKSLEEVEQSMARPVSPQAAPATADTPADPGLPPAPPPPRVKDRIRTPSATPEATPNAPKAPPPRVTTAQTQLPAAWRNIPELSALEDERQVQALVLLNQFFQHYARQLDRPVPNFDAEPKYFSELAAVAAVDFLKRAALDDGPADPADFRSRAAATYIVREYERRKNAALKSSG
jgi:hypothetical protein